MEHGLDVHGDPGEGVVTIRDVSHLNPVQPTSHAHMNELPLLKHVPPLRHGLDAHGDTGEGVVTIIDVSHCNPVQPARHAHMKELPLP